MCANSKYSNTCVRELATFLATLQGYISSLGFKCICNELDHIVALDNRINHELSSLHSMVIYPKPDHTLYYILTGKRKA